MNAFKKLKSSVYKLYATVYQVPLYKAIAAIHKYSSDLRKKESWYTILDDLICYEEIIVIQKIVSVAILGKHKADYTKALDIPSDLLNRWFNKFVYINGKNIYYKLKDNPYCYYSLVFKEDKLYIDNYY